MVTLELTPAEAETLRSILRNELTELRGEIRETDVRAYRERLLDREQVITRLLQCLPTVPEPAPA